LLIYFIPIEIFLVGGCIFLSVWYDTDEVLKKCSYWDVFSQKTVYHKQGTFSMPKCKMASIYAAFLGILALSFHVFFISVCGDGLLSKAPRKRKQFNHEEHAKKKELFGVIVFESDHDMPPKTAYLCYDDRGFWNWFSTATRAMSVWIKQMSRVIFP